MGSDDDEDWRKDALCLEYDPDLFFPPEENPSQRAPALVIAPDAVAVCFRCKVNMECREWALRHRVDGIWAGTTSRERAVIQKEQHITPIDMSYGLDLLVNMERKSTSDYEEPYEPPNGEVA